MNQLANRRWHALALAAVAMTLAACVGTGQPVRTDASNQGRAVLLDYRIRSHAEFSVR